MTPVLADQERGREDRDDDLHDEDDGRHLGRRTTLQRTHLGDQPEARRQPRGGHPDDDRHWPAPMQSVGGKLGRQAAPGQRRAGAEGHQPAVPAQHEGDDPQQSHPPEHTRDREPAAVPMRRIRRDDGEQRYAGQDAENREGFARADGLVEVARPDQQQQDQPEREGRLHDGERGEQQRRRLQRPAEEVQPGAEQPAAAADQAQQQRRAHPVVRRRLAGVQRLEGEPDVVQR
jgi:hypothetical protein